MKGDDILKSVCREIEIVTVTYKCQSFIKKQEKLYDIKYDKEKSKWSLYGF